MNINDVFKKYDPKSECVWKEWNGAKFFIAPQGNKMQQKEMLAQFTLQEANDFETKGPMVFGAMMAGEALKKIYNLYSSTIIFDWELENDEGKKIPFTAKKCAEMMSEHLDFGNWVLLASQEVAREKEAKESEIEKK
jgi:hypothetical protein